MSVENRRLASSFELLLSVERFVWCLVVSVTPLANRRKLHVLLAKRSPKPHQDSETVSSHVQQRTRLECIEHPCSTNVHFGTGDEFYAVLNLVQIWRTVWTAETCVPKQLRSKGRAHLHLPRPKNAHEAFQFHPVSLTTRANHNHGLSVL